MIAQTETVLVPDRSMRPWMDRFVVSIMVAGGVATIMWIAAMLVASWQIAGALIDLSTV